MTGVLERDAAHPEAPLPPDTTADTRPKPRTWPRLRADLRLARRQVRRGWATSMLVVLLILLPMALTTGAIVFGMSRVATDDERLTAELGHADAWAAVVYGPDPTMRQYLDEPHWWQNDYDENGIPVHEPQPMIESAAPLLPDDAIEIGEGSVEARTADGVGTVGAVIGDAGAEILDGRFELHEGERATGDDEAMISRGARERLGIDIGDELVVTEPAGTYTVTGILSRAEDSDAAQTVFLPGTDANRALQNIESTRWYVPEWDATADGIAELNAQGVIALDRDLFLDPGDGAAPTYGYMDGAAWSIGSLVLAGLIFCGYLVVMLAGAAFSVSARRQQRALAVATSVGATRGDVFRIVVLQGTVLGLLGGVLGAAAGVGLGIVFAHALDDGAASSFWGLHVPWWAIVGVVVFATIVGTISALAPARSATKGEVIGALRGARKPVRLESRRPIWGSILLLVGVGVTVASGLGLAALMAPAVVEYGGPLMTLCVVGIIAGPVLLQVGVILSGHWLLSLLAKPVSRLGLSPRIAARDAVASPGRIVPAFASIAAVAFLSSAALGGVGVTIGQMERNWYYQAPLGSVVMSAWANTDVDGWEEALVGGEDLARARLERTEPAAMGSVWQPGYVGEYDENGELTNPDAVQASPVLQDFVACGPGVSGRCDDPGTAAFGYSSAIQTVDPDELAPVIGREPTDAEVAAFRDGAALVTDPRFLTESGEVVVRGYTLGDVEKYYVSGGAYFSEDGTVNEDALPDPQWQRDIDGLDLELVNAMPWPVLVTAETAADLGLVGASGFNVVASYETPPTTGEMDALRAETGSMEGQAAVSMYPYAENGPPEPAAWLWLILGATSVLVVGASGVALGLARVERRPDDATLAAVGAAPGVRRGIAFWQALLITGVGAATGAAAGILPIWGITIASRDQYSSLEMGDVPWAWLALLAVGLPLAIAVVSWLVPPRHPDLTRRTAIA